MNFHEQAFINTFVQSARRDRVSSLLSSSKNRHKFTHELAHNASAFLEPACLRSIPTDKQHVATIHKILLRMGAPSTCYVISESELDGREVDLASALEEVVGRGMGTIISCLPGRVGYFEGEWKERYILQK